MIYEAGSWTPACFGPGIQWMRTRTRTRTTKRKRMITSRGLLSSSDSMAGNSRVFRMPLLQLLSRLQHLLQALLQLLLLLVFCSTLLLLSASAHPPRAEPPQPPCPEQTMVEAGAIRVVLPRKRIIWVLKKTSQILHFWLYLKNLKKYIRPIMVGQDFFGWLRFPFA